MTDRRPGTIEAPDAATPGAGSGAASFVQETFEGSQELASRRDTSAEELGREVGSVLRLPESHGIGMARSAATAQRFVRQLGDVGSSHHHLDAGGTEGVRCPVSARDHPRHGADTDQTDLPVLHEPDEAGVIHRLRVAIQEKHFVARRCARLQEEHPQMRHEVSGHAVVGIVE